MCMHYAPEEDVSENDGNPEPDADELQCQDGDVRLRPRLRVRGLSADVHSGGNSKSATAYSRFEWTVVGYRDDEARETALSPPASMTN